MLTNEEKKVIWDKGTETPYSGKYWDFFKDGVYVCKNCGNPLFTSEAKFKADCGWPSFDDSFPDAVKRIPDGDGMRTEIQCAKCSGHLGHVFEGEKYTKKDTRHCVNSLSLKFVPREDIKSIVLGGGCFWCLEAIFQRIPGVLFVTSGYSGGDMENPSYEEVCTGETGHAEVVKVEFNIKEISLEKILNIFFLAHDPTTLNRQGNDIGTQYRSVIFFSFSEDEKVIKDVINEVKKEYKENIVTEVQKLEHFYEAEDYHKNYYDLNRNNPYCRLVIKPKLDQVLQ